MKSGAMSQALGERVRERSAATNPETASSSDDGEPGVDRPNRQRVTDAASRERDHQKRREHHNERNPGRLCDHDGFEVPAILRRQRRGLDDAAGDSGKEGGGAVDTREPHVDQPANCTDNGRDERGDEDQRQEREQLGHNRRGELQARRGAHDHCARRATPRNETDRRSGKRQRHDGRKRAEHPRQRNMDIARRRSPRDARCERCPQ